MQTFLPYADFYKSAACLDRQRLGKQRVEVLTLLKILKQGPYEGDKKTPWYNHKCTKMWLGYEQALVNYGISITTEWINRGYKDTCLEKISAYADGKVVYPPWFGNEDFHLSHQSNLVRKKPEYYRQFFPEVPDNLSYYWPV